MAVPVVADGDAVLLGPGADEIARTHDLDLLAALEVTGPSGSAAKPGAVVTVPVVPDDPSAPARAVLLVGVGGHSPDELRRAGAALARATRDRASVATSVPALAETDAAFEAFVVGMMLGSFAFHWRSQPPEHTPVARVVLAGLADPQGLAPVLDRALAVGGAGWRARMLASVPSNLKTPAWLADQAVVAGEEAGVDVRVSDVADLTRRGFGGLLAVGRAAAAPPRLVEMTYTPRGRGGRERAARRAGGQGHHLRHRRPLDQARRGDGQHEARHDRRRRRHRDHGRARRRRVPGAGHRPRRRRRERRRGRRDAPR